MSNNPESKKMSELNEIEINHKAKGIIFKSMELILNNLKENMEHVARPKYFKHTQKFINLVYDGLKNKRRFFLLASGRSGMILQCFATRLVHLGASVYMITNLASLPPLRRKDILIVLSGSGTTNIVVSLLETYVNTIKPYGIVAITSHPDTIIGRIGDITIKLKGRTKKDNDKISADTAILTPEGTQFEIAAFVYLDAIIAELAVKLGKTNADLLKGHSETV
ncbi:MAG: SIS domain-containing protein [Promethearchaeota archaeon]